MPITLPPLSRRGFAAAAVASLGALRADGPAPAPERWALFSDTHIPADPAAQRGTVRMAENLRRCVTEALAWKPARALVNGDAALKNGQPGDYATFVGLLQPLRAAGVPIHATLGNHDHRENFLAGCAGLRHAERPVAAHHVGVVEGVHANWFLLDSLEKVDNTPGLLGKAQLQWLAAALDKRPGKPALIALHHHPVSLPLIDVRGLQDADDLWEVVRGRRQVKALFFGHTHHWAQVQLAGIHLVNLPPTAYVFQKSDPNGWVELEVRPDGAGMVLRTLDPQHPKAGETHALKWRADRA